MKPKRIILIRHGQSVGNINKKIYESVPDYKINLSKDGKEQAVKCGVMLKELLQENTSSFYLSPYNRAVQTYNIINSSFEKGKIKVMQDQRLREQNWGNLKSSNDAMKIRSERKIFGSFYYTVPGGEAAVEVYDRVSSFISDLKEEFKCDEYPENCIIISHGITLRIFLMKWFNWCVNDYEKVKDLENCTPIILEKNDKNEYTLLSELQIRKQ